MGDDMTLQQHLAALSTEQLMVLYNTLLDAGIKHEYNRNAQVNFKRLKRRSKGRLKKIYAALAKCNQDELEQVFKALVDYER